MTEKRIALDLAEFVDGPRARGLGGPRPSETRRLAELFLRACYEDLGKQPRLLDDQDLAQVLGRLVPARMGAGDPLAEHAPAVLEALLGHLEDTQVVPQAYELRSSLDAALEAFAEAVRSGRHAHSTAVRQDPVVHHADKLGRNDPCFCGSGKKFKKCHGKGA
jgi:hypothetical protein